MASVPETPEGVALALLKIVLKSADMNRLSKNEVLDLFVACLIATRGERWDQVPFDGLVH